MIFCDVGEGVAEPPPTNPHFNEAIEGQFRIGEMYLNGKKIKFLGISLANALDRAVASYQEYLQGRPDSPDAASVSSRFTGVQTST